MVDYKLKIIQELDTFSSLAKMNGSTGFLFKFEGGNYIISVHHFLPLKKSYLKISDKEYYPLTKNKDIYWNEINIFNCTDSKILKSNKIIKNYKTRFEEVGKEIKIEINGTEEKFPFHDYRNICQNPFSNIKNIYMSFYIGVYSNDEILKKLKGLSGAPVFSSDNQLIGIFTKYLIENNHILGLVIPTIYLIKSLMKNDNTKIYKLNNKNLDINTEKHELTKIGKYELTKDFTIYYPLINNRISLDQYCNFEGDTDKFIVLTNSETKEDTSVNFIPINNFDLSLNLERRDKNIYKFNTGLITLLNHFGCTTAIQKILKDYLTYEEPWIHFEDSDFL